MTRETKYELLRDVARCLSAEPEVRKVYVFGSFLTSDDPNDLDIAVFSDSEAAYLPLAMRYRELTRDVAKRIALDIIPLRPDASGTFMDRINEGTVIYERPR